MKPPNDKNLNYVVVEPCLNWRSKEKELHVVIDQRLQQQQHQLGLNYCTVGMVVRGSGPDLVIDHLQYSDEGSYECRASNIIAGIKKQTKSKYLEVFFSNFFWWFFRLNFHRQVGALLFFYYKRAVIKKKGFLKMHYVKLPFLQLLLWPISYQWMVQA